MSDEKKENGVQGTAGGGDEVKDKDPSYQLPPAPKNPEDHGISMTR